MAQRDKAIITCALTGVLTDPRQHPVPVTPKDLAASAREAWDAGASCMHVHFRQQGAGQGHLPSWDPALALEVAEAIRAACKGVILNFTTGVIGRDQSGPIACLRAARPEIAACNAGSLNYLKTRANGDWAWPPMLFENPVEKIEELLAVMHETGTKPEFECFDTGILRSVSMFAQAGLVRNPQVNLVMGVHSGMPADPDLLAVLMRYLPPGNLWQTTVIGRAEVWALHRKAAELGGHLRSGVEDTFYLPDGSRAAGNGALIEALTQVARGAGRDVASAEEARVIWGLA
ncbi:3-keto-5-aminohexanoate cleavage protein [Pararhodobacter oceanensis]|uniref:3-keto-5-aminohexanoate cleavage protein n=1 Tax=Pararhodobacter oceanensis TaxID=2172121 RepID=A0A2T8HWM1_9RHOB|nr:3-keto-5-aminohexanoate cleavage protein [Pararhodobacter oceanensis]PVH29813.1 3-keto-5-aminohexanoate cleavage protein [Pararhodobacter oceanensis]